MSSNLIGGGGMFVPRPDIGPGIGYGFENPIPNDGTNPVADQTQQMANNPVYGQQSPFQPPQPNPGLPPNVGIGGGPAPIDGMGNMGFGKGMGGGMFGLPPGVGIGLPYDMPQTPPLQGTPMQGSGGQLVGGPAGKPITNPVSNARQVPIQQTQPQQRFAGGLRPAPRNYRPPVRRMR